MYFVRLFEVTGHLGQDLAVADAHIYSEAQSIPDLILDGVRNSHWIRIDLMSTRHIQEALVDGVFFNDRCILPANVHKGPGAFFVEPEVWPCQEHIRTFAQGHSHRFTGFDTELLGRNGFGKDDAVALLPIAANC